MVEGTEVNERATRGSREAAADEFMRRVASSQSRLHGRKAA
jgi:hypothetical protein